MIHKIALTLKLTLVSISKVVSIINKVVSIINLKKSTLVNKINILFCFLKISFEFAQSGHDSLLFETDFFSYF